MQHAENIPSGIRDLLVDREPRFEADADERVFRRHRKVMERDRDPGVAAGASADPIAHDAVPLLRRAILGGVSVPPACPVPQDFVRVRRLLLPHQGISR